MPTTTKPPSPSLPPSMRAWQITSRGSPPSSLTFNTSAPLPSVSPTSSNLLIRISYAALNPADLALMSLLPTFLPWRRHAVPGMDLVGEIVSAGAGAPDHLRPGVKVCGALGISDALSGGGTLAEYACVPAARVAVAPAVLEGNRMAEAAGLGVAAQTAVEMVRTAGLEGESAKGKRALVIGASGGVGALLVQVLSARGAVTVGVCSGSNEEFVKRLGAGEIVDYRAHDLAHVYLKERYSGDQFDIIFDCVGSDTLFDHSPGYLKPDGLFLSIVGGKTQGIVPFIRNQMWPTLLGGVPRRYKLILVAPNGQLQRKVVDLVNEGAIKEVPIDSEFEMEDAAKGFERLASKRARGKIIIRVKP